MNQSIQIKNALISVFNKSKIVDLAHNLLKKNIALFSTDGTADQLDKLGLKVTKISRLTNFPEIMDGRIKTLHPKIYAGILRRPKIDDLVIQSYNIITFDIIIVNFYSFQDNITSSNSQEEQMKYMDIGGPTMIRAAIKNYKNIIILTDPNDYESILNKIKFNKISYNDKLTLAIKALKYLQSYDQCILKYLQEKNLTKNQHDSHFPEVLNMTFIKKQNLRYGENPHQKSAFYIKQNIPQKDICNTRQIQGKPLSYNNISDTDIAIECIQEFIKPTCVIIKHGNPCGVATKKNTLDAYLSAYQSDPISAFGGIIAFNYPIDPITAQTILNKQFLEVLITPPITKKTLNIIKLKKNIRLLIINNYKYKNKELHFKYIHGGLLLQDPDIMDTNSTQWKVVTHRKPSELELKDSIFCWKVVKFVKSNAIVYCKNLSTIAIGAGQTSRISSTIIANMKLKEKKQEIFGCTLASDAFLPFKDNIHQASKLGITCIIQPGGSIRDHETIQAANKHDISMIFTFIRHFKH